MASGKPSLLVTGIAGSLGARLLPLLEGFNVIGLDTHPPLDPAIPFEFEKIDLGMESSCGRMTRILRETRAIGVVHLAFIVDPLRTGVLDPDRMWRINVAGTARVIEAIAETNRLDGSVEKFIHLSSVSVYGPLLTRPARENDALHARSLTYAIHKREADLAVQARFRDLGGCDVYILRPQIFSGASVDNYMINCIRGTAYGPGRVGQMLKRRGKQLPLLLPMGAEYLQHKLQFVHVDDVARVIAWLLPRPKATDPLTILNIAGRGDPLTVAQCAEIAKVGVKRVPTVALCRKIVELMWSMGITSIPGDAFPYLIGSYTLETLKLRTLLGPDYEEVIRYTSAAALADSKPQSIPLSVAEIETAS